MIYALVFAAMVWLVMGAIFRSRDRARSVKDRAELPPFIKSESDRTIADEKRATEALEALFGITSRAPQSASMATSSRSADAGRHLGGADGHQREAPTHLASGMTPRASSVPAHIPGRKPSGCDWIGPGQAVKVAGTTIGGGLIYIGPSSSASGTFADGAGVIDPSLPVAATDVGATGLHYWPRYRNLTPEGRRAYLNWLVGGRIAPLADVGFVFLFFYGLERRLFIDQAFSDASSLIAEVERLLPIYGESGSFRQYSEAFLSAARFVSGSVGEPKLEPRATNSYELPIGTRIHLGRLLATGQSLDGDATLLWVLGHPETWLRTPGQRCFDELAALWRVRFAERNPRGLKIAVPQRRVKLTYRMAANSQSVELVGSYGDLPDVIGVTAPLQGLRDLLSECMTELDPYSRFVGRRPETRGTAEAIVHLPVAIRASVGNEVFSQAKSRVSAALGADMVALTTLRHLADLVGFNIPANGQASQAISRLAFLLDQLDVGVEPDRRYGGTQPSLDAPIAAFIAPGGAPVSTDNVAYSSARVAMEIGTLAAALDGGVSKEEFDVLAKEVSAAPGLATPERLRLQAFLKSVQAEPPRLQAGLKRAAALEADQRSALARVALGTVMAKGHATADEVRFLERLHKALQLPTESVHAAMHKHAADVQRGSFTILPEDDEPGVAIPREAVGSASGGVATPGSPLQLDPMRLARIRAETSQVSTLLSNVFGAEEDGAVPIPEAATPTSEKSPYPGLDASHGHLLALLVARQHVPFVEFEAAAREVKLLPGAALEIINDWSFERYDAAIAEEDGETVSVAEDLLPTVAAD